MRYITCRTKAVNNMTVYAEFKKALDSGFNEKALSILKKKWYYLARAEIREIARVKKLDGAIQKCLIKRGVYDRVPLSTSGKWDEREALTEANAINLGQLDVFHHLIQRRRGEITAADLAICLTRAIHLRHKKIIRYFAAFVKPPSKRDEYHIWCGFSKACGIGNRKIVRSFLEKSIIIFDEAPSVHKFNRHHFNPGDVNSDMIKIILNHINCESVIRRICGISGGSDYDARVMKMMMKRVDIDSPKKYFRLLCLREEKDNVRVLLSTDYLPNPEWSDVTLNLFIQDAYVDPCAPGFLPEPTRETAPRTAFSPKFLEIMMDNYRVESHIGTFLPLLRRACEDRLMPVIRGILTRSRYEGRDVAKLKELVNNVVSEQNATSRAEEAFLNDVLKMIDDNVKKQK